MNDGADDPRGYASPPCFAHELEPGPDGYVAVDRTRADDVARWREGERRRLIDERLAVPAAERRRIASVVAERLDRLLRGVDGAVVSLYWPFRGELNLRPWMRAVHASGARVALPVVEAAGRPLTFREWTPEGRMEPGVWKIPVPVDGEVITPSIVIAPLVGYDGDCYRLGYGGGFFDRTLERLRADGKHPRVIGVGHAGARIPTIHPQPHDIPMDVVVTETEQFERTDRPHTDPGGGARGVRRGARNARPER